MKEDTNVPQPQPRYRVLAAVSTRRRPDPECEDWLNFEVGREYGATDFPAHVPLEHYVRSGHLAIVRPRSGVKEA